jgi:hypothetical protein
MLCGTCDDCHVSNVTFAAHKIIGLTIIKYIYFFLPTMNQDGHKINKISNKSFSLRKPIKLS